ncbi:MAG: hypothetical protein RLZZ301_295 [Bacteroidota bacterium]|jgi:hypothetical protein
MRPDPRLKQQNIAEYLLYLFQLESLVRSLALDINQITQKVLEPAIKDPFQLKEQVQWYSALVNELKNRGLEKEGHCEEVQEVMIELVYLHTTLLTVVNDQKYKTLCEQAAEALNEFKAKSSMAQRNDVEVLLHAMFMKLQLKMRGQEISAETEAAMDLLRIQLAYLSRAYQQLKNGDWNALQN